MDIFKEWKDIQEEKFNSLIIQKQEIMETIYQDSNSTISTLKTRLKYKRNWIILFLVCMVVWAAFSMKQTAILPVIAVLFLFYALGFVVISKFISNMSSNIDFSEETLSLMKRNYTAIKNALRFESAWGVTVFPIAIIAGSILPSLYKGRSLDFIMNDSTFLIGVIALVLVMTPLAYFATNKMNKSAYGGLMDKLQKNIHQMEMVA